MKATIERRSRLHVSMSTRIFLLFGILLMLTMLVLYIVLFRLSEENLIKQSNRRIASILELSVGQLDQEMIALEDRLLNMMVDEEMYDMMSTLRESDAISDLQNLTLNRYLLTQLIGDDSLASVNIQYNDHLFSARMQGTTHSDALREDSTWRRIQDAQGSPVWLDARECRAITGSDRYVCLARVLNMTDLVHFRQAFNGDSDKPVALMCFTSNILTRNLERNLGISGVGYAFIDPSGGAVQINSRESLPSDLLDERLQGRSGYGTEGETLYYYFRSRHTGWVHMIQFDRDILVGDMMRDMRTAMIRVLIAVLVAMLGISALFSRALSSRVQRLTYAVRQLEKGDFGYRVEMNASDEIGYLAEQFDRMSQSIQQLIEENLQVRLREKDAEIMSLTIQFNPHYLYNTLNAIYWVALQGDSREAAHMLHDLAQMMRYTSDQKQECMLLSDDVTWLNQYLYLMKVRYGDLYTVDWDLQKGIENMRVPKLFLQPLLENSIIHGFKDMETGGHIVISGRDKGEYLEFQVSDNGCGIAQDVLDTLLDPQDSSRIGLANVHRRIQLIYGDQYGLVVRSAVGRGTTIIARIAKNNADN